MSPRRWLLAAFMDSFLEKVSADVPSDRLDKLDAPPLDLLMPKRTHARAWLGLAARSESSASYRSSWRSGRSRSLVAESGQEREPSIYAEAPGKDSPRVS